MGDRYIVKENHDRLMGKCWSIWDNQANEFGGGNFAYSLKAAAERSCASMNAMWRKASTQSESPKDDGFLTSMAVGMATDSALAGVAVGGNLAGALIGEALATPSSDPSPCDSSSSSDSSCPDFSGGGGDFGGGGSGGSFDGSGS